MVGVDRRLLCKFAGHSGVEVWMQEKKNVHGILIVHTQLCYQSQKNTEVTKKPHSAMTKITYLG